LFDLACSHLYISKKIFAKFKKIKKLWAIYEYRSQLGNVRN
jgi:hypothetical protein